MPKSHLARNLANVAHRAIFPYIPDTNLAQPPLPLSLQHAALAHLQLQHGVLRVVPNGLDGRASHEVEQAQDEVGALAQDVVRLAAEHAELHVVAAVLQGATAGHMTRDSPLLAAATSGVMD